MHDNDPRQFGLTAADLRALADMFYPDGDQRRRRMTANYRTAARAGLGRFRISANLRQCGRPVRRRRTPEL